MIGGGGHASILMDMLMSQERDILAVISPDQIDSRSVFSGIKHFTADEDIHCFSPKDVKLVNGIGVLPHSRFKRRINELYLDLGYVFETVVSEQSVVSKYAKLESGAQVFPGSIVQAGAVIGEHVVINSGAVIEHDCCIGAYSHIAPRATLCGSVETETDVYVGAGATVIQGVKIAKEAIVGAGATLTKNLMASEVAYPARSTTKRIEGI
jgi:sugar O-acyltransferase (sialic acid O-acetyltransferase NeuD family)